MKQPTPPPGAAAELEPGDPAAEERRAGLRARGARLLREGEARAAAEAFAEAAAVSEARTASRAEALVLRARALQAALDAARGDLAPAPRPPAGAFAEALTGALGAPAEAPPGMACDLPPAFLAEHGPDYEEAEAALRAALAVDPRLPAARRHLARLFMEEGEWMAASVEWENLRALEPLTDREASAAKYCEKRSLEGVVQAVKSWGQRLLGKIGIDPGAFVVQKNPDGSTTISTRGAPGAEAAGGGGPAADPAPGPEPARPSGAPS